MLGVKSHVITIKNARNRKSKKDRQHNEQKDKQQSTKQLGFMMLNALSTIFELYRDSQVYWRRKAQ
jgi:hypothetical protein